MLVAPAIAAKSPARRYGRSGVASNRRGMERVRGAMAAQVRRGWDLRGKGRVA